MTTEKSIPEAFQSRQKTLTKWGMAYNPFTAAPLVTHEDVKSLFVNREEELETLFAYLAPEGGLRVYIRGARGSGKTSFLHSIQERLEGIDAIIPIYLSSPSWESPDAFLSSLTSSVQDAIHPDNPNQRPISDDGEWTLNKLVDFFDRLPKHFVALIDNIDGNAESICQALRPIRDWLMSIPVTLIFAGDTDTLTYLRNNSAVAEMFDLVLDLKPLERPAVQEIVQKRLGKASKSKTKSIFSDQAIHRIHHYSRGNPRRIMSLCRNTVQHALICGASNISEKDVSDAYLANMERFEAELSDSQRKVLEYFRKTPSLKVVNASHKGLQDFTGLARSSLSQILAEMESDGLLTNHKVGRESFYTPYSIKELEEREEESLPMSEHGQAAYSTIEATLRERLTEEEVAGNVDEAIEKAKAIKETVRKRKAWPKVAEALLDLGRLYRKKRDFTQALRYSLEALDIGGKHGLKDVQAQAHCHIGSILEDMKQLAEAEREYLKAIELDPEFVWVHLRLGSLLHQLKRYEEAEREYRKAIELGPGFAMPHYNLGILFRGLKRYDEAEREYRKAIELDPKDADPHNNLGDLFRDLKRYDDAERESRRAIELDPKSPHPHGNLGEIFNNLKRYDDAEREYKEALRLAEEQGLSDIVELARNSLNSLKVRRSVK